jgi:hypothetical protein
VHYFSDRCGPSKAVSPQLIEGTGSNEERIFIVQSPLGEVIEETIRLHWELEWPDQVVVDERHRAFFEALKLSLTDAVPKID